MQAQARRFSRAGVMLIGLALMLLSVVPAAKADIYNPADWAPMVWSDKADYAPGEQVTLTGAHWQPGETVHIRVNDDTGSSWDRDVDVTARRGRRDHRRVQPPELVRRQVPRHGHGVVRREWRRHLPDSNIKVTLSRGVGLLGADRSDGIRLHRLQHRQR